MRKIAHPVICAICGKRFDRDSVQAVKHGARRYSHYACEPNGELVPLVKKEKDPDLVKLEDYIKQKFGNNANWAAINKQIKTYTEQNDYSFSGILKSLVWFYDIKSNSIEKSNGTIGM